MDVPERADITPEPIAIIRCRELLGDEADVLSDDEVREVARHAEAMARILIALPCRTAAFTNGHGATTDLAAGRRRV